jgi:RNA polymerase sigma-70 factor (ECF subfamily)
VQGAHDEGRFRAVALQSLDGLRRFAMSLCHDAGAADDLVQEAYLRALSAPRRPAPDENVRSWLFTILHNVWRNQVRRRRFEAGGDALEAFEHAVASEGDPGELLDQARAGQAVREAVRALPEAFREVLLLRCVEGFSYQEIAAIVGCPAGTVMSRLSRARGLLRRALAPAGPRAVVAGGARS